MIQLTIKGEPVGKGRPRSTKDGGMYTPPKTRAYEKLVGVMWQLQCRQKLEGALWVQIDCYYAVPKSTTKARREKMLWNEIRPTKKPDADNVSKIILDALNGLAYEDDAQVVQLEVRKFYADEPRVAVRIGEI